MSHVGFQTHEYNAYHIYTEQGRQPYFAIGRLVDAYNGQAHKERFTIDGREWDVTLRYQPDTGLKPAPDDPIPDDSPMHEYWLKARPVDGQDRSKATFNISPRWTGQCSMSGEQLSTPFQHDTITLATGETIDMPDAGVNVDVRCSNLDVDHIPDLFRRFLRALADRAQAYLDYDYFQTLHETSNVRDLELYLRHSSHTQDQLVDSDGILMQIQHLLANREGSNVTYHADNNETVGHNHRLKLSDNDADALVPGHQYGKQLKSYHPRNVINDPSNPLYHPKFGILIKNSLNQDTLYVHELDEMLQEIEETAINVLSWAGIDTSPPDNGGNGGGPFIADDHFTPEPSTTHIDRYPDPLPTIEASQESHLLRVITQGTSADLDIMQELATDGGHAHHAMLEDATGYSSSTLYRMLQRLPELVESDNGIIQFRSEKLYQDVKDILERTTRTIDYATNAVANILDVDAQALTDAEGELTRFIQKYAVDLQPQGDDLTVKINAICTQLKSLQDDYPHIARVVSELRRVLHTGSRFDTTGRITVTWTEPSGRSKSAPLNDPRLNHLA